MNPEPQNWLEHDDLQEVIQGIIDFFHCFMLVDFQTDTCIRLDDPDHPIGVYPKLIERVLSIVENDADYQRMLRNLQKENVIASLGKTLHDVQYEYLVHVNGKTEWAHLDIVCLKRDDNDIPVKVLLTVRSVTEQKKKDMHYQTQLERQIAVIDALCNEYSTLCLIDTANLSMRLYRSSSMFSRLVREGEHYLNSLTEYLHLYSADDEREDLLQAIQPENLLPNISNHKIYSLNYKRVFNDEVTYHQMNFAMVKRAGKKDMIVLGFRDRDALVREELRKEKLLRDALTQTEAANKAKSAFLSNMSHDIRTPMNGIIGMTAIAATHLDDKERVADCLQKITTASKHLLSLINEVLDMSKIESGKVDLNEDDINMSELIDNLLMMTRPQMKAHHHELTVNIRNVQHEHVIGDSLRIQQVFTNLMSNAVKYTPDGGRINLTVSEKSMPQKNLACFEFIFEDNGYGMSEDYQKVLFEPFTRAKDEKLDKVQGTGLGMSITRNIVRMMGGDIQVESQLGVGSKFTITIFLKLQHKKHVEYAEFIDLPVLVADDDQLSCESACGMLNDLGMKSEWVLSGQEAVERTALAHQQGRDFFAVILDWKMPEMNGVQAAKAIRQQIGNDMPIIIISAYDWSEIEQEARNCGVTAFISKPLFKSKLLNLFSDMLGANDEQESSAPLLDFTQMHLEDKRVLIVEDNELNIEIATEILSMTGIQVEIAENGRIALEKISASPAYYFDIVLMDVQMPVMNGYEATAHIRALDREDIRTLPIVAMSANAFADDVLASRNAGMNEHISKPLDLKRLAEILNQFILKGDAGA